ncbi:HAD-IB family hydrolase [Actinomycetospora corticicola]|uniref:1-acyl-sn-glycerol-3-phosphate acyltransferase n=1 Tax=Actinomycetospora corticicola TaxID=663602 RepID=A0A7Y9E0D0_9PSEU|nr:1-acylglycerol-3-phosphate O-acyltransferase [Actinomycetospora corticicola]NYD38808.1 putative phosphoserine phosphatase/1-acylglycerol-3-phosphate O-acyltransferase [Actinomycetospora corticicola]
MTAVVRAESSLAARIDAAPPGETVTAFVAVDGGLLAGSPLAPFATPDSLWGRFVADVVAGVAGPAVVTPDDVVRVVRARRGRTVDEVADECAATFRGTTASWLHPEVWRLAVRHAGWGHRVVLVSAATPLDVAPLAEALGADDVVATRLSYGGPDGDVVAGLGSPVCTGPDAAAAVVGWADDHDVDLGQAFVYAPADDRALLDLAAHPVVVGGPDGVHPALPVAPRGAVPPVEAIGGTVGFYGGFLSATLAAMGSGALRLSRHHAINLAGSLGSELALGIAGVDVEVSGAEHLWSHRPAVFVFNHQSALDPIVTMTMLRHDFTGVAKAEARSMPLFGQLFVLADVAFVERGNTRQAKEALEPAVEKIRRGMSLLMAPEGTRSPTPRPGRFKKGAFHIAMQAGVPMVPIVLENAGELMWRHDATVRPGTVRATVLPPIDTAAWSVDTLDDHVAHVRGLFLETLGLREKQ